MNSYSDINQTSYLCALSTEDPGKRKSLKGWETDEEKQVIQLAFSKGRKSF